MSKSPFLLTCVPDNAERFALWLRGRGGIALWKSENLSNPGASWCTPALTEEGTDYPKPNWQTNANPALVVCEPEQVGVEIPAEFKRLKIHLVQRGMKVVLTDASTRKVTLALEAAGDGAFYTFEDDEAIIWRIIGTVGLSEWLEAMSTPLPALTPDQLELLRALDSLGGVTRGFAALRFNLSERLRRGIDAEWVRTTLRILTDQGVIDKTMEGATPIPKWSLTVRGVEVLKRETPLLTPEEL